MTEQDFYQIIAEDLGLRAAQIANTIELLDSGNTVPFIARYRKEATGKLTEEEIRKIEERIRYLRNLQDRKQTILNSIAEQGKLTPELESRINKALKLQEVEDLYLPYRPKKRTRATQAREKGLEPLAQMILKQEIISGAPEECARPFVHPEKGVNSPQEALQGASDIIAEIISDDADVRQTIREYIHHNGRLVSKAKNPEKSSEYDLYYKFRMPIKSIIPHQILAINRGERENYLGVNIAIDEEWILEAISKFYIQSQNCIFFPLLTKTIREAYRRLIFPSIEREIRNELTEKAEAHAIQVFARNLRQLLLQPPLKGKKIMGIDPGYRTGCKLAVIDETGRYLEGATIFPHPPQNEIFESKTVLRKLIDKWGVEIIAIGNGTASRETELFIADLISDLKANSPKPLSYIIVNEAGASVYSASRIAQQEFPDLEASMRGNISIARRVLDPLAELVKIDPQSIGVGLYQHDVNQNKLEEALRSVVESAVNLVGVNVNTASSSLLRYISGLTSRTAENIVAYRDQHGPFRNRQELKEVEGIGEKVFQQAAGFLRIPDGDNPLDNTSIHPESYTATQKLLERFEIYDRPTEWKSIRQKIESMNLDLKNLAHELEVGEPTLEDILINLEKPGRDPREEMPQPLLRTDVLKIEDLQEGMILQGTVRNVVDFGAFVDIGIKREGLIHVSEMGPKYVKDPHQVVSVGDIVTVKVIGVELEKGRVKLSLKV